LQFFRERHEKSRQQSKPAQVGISRKWRKTQMSNPSPNLYVKFQGLRKREEGQDLVEYALVLTIISLALVFSISGIATAVNSAFSNISSSLGAV
jgi:pilus assembly protein Flp/PilA